MRRVLKWKDKFIQNFFPEFIRKIEYDKGNTF
jgi:hypothetical protein